MLISISLLFAVTFFTNVCGRIWVKINTSISQVTISFHLSNIGLNKHCWLRGVFLTRVVKLKPRPNFSDLSVTTAANVEVNPAIKTHSSYMQPVQKRKVMRASKSRLVLVLPRVAGVLLVRLETSACFTNQSQREIIRNQAKEKLNVGIKVLIL